MHLLASVYFNVVLRIKRIHGYSARRDLDCRLLAVEGLGGKDYHTPNTHTS